MFYQASIAVQMHRQAKYHIKLLIVDEVLTI